MLAEPAEYQFWKQPTWRLRFSQLRKQRYWIIGFSLSIALTIFLLIGLWNREQQGKQLLALSATQMMLATLNYTPVVITPQFTPSVTAIPAARQQYVTYPEGQFYLVRWEFPTNRPITLNQSGTGELATPAIGSKFLAIEYKFICRIAICEAPPQGQVSLKLADGQVIAYSYGNRPILAEYPDVARVAQDKETFGWLVFEVPDRAIPVALSIKTGNADTSPVYELPWPKN